MIQTIQILKSVAELDAVAEASQNGPVLLFKHSVTCPISARAQEQFVGIDGVPRYALVVQYAQDVSDAVEEKFGALHASPQLLIIEKGEVTETLAHSQIKAEAIGEHLTSR